MHAPMQIGRTGLVVAIVFGGWHLCWSILVALGAAQPLLDFVFWAHFLKPVYTVVPFELIRAVILLVLTSAVGFAIGAAFAWVWNTVHET